MRRPHLPRHHHARTRGRHDTRLVVLLTIGVVAFTFSVSDDSGDVTVADLQQVDAR